MSRRLLLLVVISSRLAALPGQTAPAWTRAAVMRAALASSPLLAVARADSASAVAQLLVARGLPDPTLSASYTKDIPQYHVTAEMPVDEIWLRGLRVRAAQAGMVASRYRQRSLVASVMLDADTLYTRALAATARATLSARTARDADSLRRMTESRRDAGDASDLDVDLAALTAGQLANAAAADSTMAATTLLQLRALVGLVDSEPALMLSDSLSPPAPEGLRMTETVTPLDVASSRAELDESTLNLAVERRSRFGSPTIMGGIETGDPTRGEPGILPTVGITLPLPLFSRNRGAIAVAAAERDRAAAEVAQVERESRVKLAVARATWAAAQTRLARDSELEIRAVRVASLALTAYREGAVPIANVLEAQRTARDVQGTYIDDVAGVLVASAMLRMLTLTSESGAP